MTLPSSGIYSYEPGNNGRFDDVSNNNIVIQVSKDFLYEKKKEKKVVPTQYFE